MKNAVLFLAVASLLLSGCFSFTPVPEARLTPLPTPPHDRPVKIFFPGETPPGQPYVKIKVLSVKRSAYHPTTNLVQELAHRAQREGADAILVLGKNVYAENSTTSTTTVDSLGVHTNTSSSSWEWQDVSALAIKYLDNLDYLSDFVRERQLWHWQSGEWKPAATGQVSYEGPTAWQPAHDQWLDLWSAYDLTAYEPAEARARFRYGDGADGLRVSNWFNRPIAWADRKYRFRETAEGRIEKAEVRVLNTPKAATETIRYFYDDQGRVSGRLLDTKDWGPILEQYYFDAAGKPLAVEWTRGDQPFLKMDWVYYRPEDVSKFLN